MSHYNNICQGGASMKQGSQQIGSFEKSVINNAKQSIEKHLSQMKIDQNQLNYALFLSIQHFRLNEHTDECVLLLLRHKANPNCQFNKQTPLTVACRKGQQLLVKVLLEHGAKPDLCNKNGQHPLSVILKDRRQNYDVAHTLIAHMNSVNFQIGGRYPIIIAVQREFFRIFQILIQKGAILNYDTENILHIVVKKKFSKLDKKKKFIKQLAGRLFLMQQDSNHKIPTDYEENQDIKTFILENFKPKIQKVEPPKVQIKQQTKEKENKSKQPQGNIKQVKKKISNSKQLDISFSEAEEQQFQQERGEQNIQTKKLYDVVQVPQQENKKQINEKKQCKQAPKIMEKDQEKEMRKEKSQQKIDNQILQKQRQQERQKIKKKLNASLGLIDSKKKNSGNQQSTESLNVGSKKKKGKVQQIIPKTLLKRKNSSLEQESIKLDKNKAATVKKQNNTKKQGNQSTFQQKNQKQKNSVEEEKMIVIIKKERQEDMSFNIQEQKIEKQSETDSQEGYIGSFSSLNEQIYQLVHKIDVKNSEKIPIVQQLVKFLDLTLRNQLFKYRENARLQLYIYGSQSTCLAIEHSDVDLLVVSDLEPLSFMRLLQDMKTFENDQIIEVKFIPGATVPVIKLKMSQKYEHFHVDLTFQNKNHMGLKCSEMIKAFMQAEPLLRPLVLVIKSLADAYDISDPYKGGLSSYAITLMVIALLQFTQKNKKTPQNVGQLLLNFFYFYGQQIDYVSQAIIIHALGLFGEQPVYCIYRLPYFTDLNPKLIIYDPLNPVNNVGRTTYRIAALKKLFSCSYLRLKSQQRCELKDIFDGSFSELLTDF